MVLLKFHLENIQILGNPFKESIRLQLQLNTASQLSFSVKDILGREVYQFTETYSEGFNQITLPTANWIANQGIFILSIQDGKYTQNYILRKE